MEPKPEQPKRLISKITYSEWKFLDSQLIIECDYVTAATILDFVAKLKLEINKES